MRKAYDVWSAWSHDETDGVLRDVAKALHARRGRFGLEMALFQGLADREHDAVSGRLGAPERSAHADRLSGDEARIAAAVEHLVLVEHPEHVLRVRHAVGRRHVDPRPDVLPDLADPAAAERLLLA